MNNLLKRIFRTVLCTAISFFVWFCLSKCFAYEGTIISAMTEEQAQYILDGISDYATSHNKTNTWENITATTLSDYINTNYYNVILSKYNNTLSSENRPTNTSLMADFSFVLVENSTYPLALSIYYTPADPIETVTTDTYLYGLRRNGAYNSTTGNVYNALVDINLNHLDNMSGWYYIIYPSNTSLSNKSYSSSTTNFSFLSESGWSVEENTNIINVDNIFTLIPNRLQILYAEINPIDGKQMFRVRNYIDDDNGESGGGSGSGGGGGTTDVDLGKIEEELGNINTGINSPDSTINNNLDDIENSINDLNNNITTVPDLSEKEEITGDDILENFDFEFSVDPYDNFWNTLLTELQSVLTTNNNRTITLEFRGETYTISVDDFNFDKMPSILKNFLQLFSVSVLTYFLLCWVKKSVDLISSGDMSEVLQMNEEEGIVDLF